MTRTIKASELEQSDVGAFIQWKHAGWNISGVIEELRDSPAGIVVTPAGTGWSTRAIRHSDQVTVLREAPAREQEARP